MNEKLFEKLIQMEESETLDFKKEFNLTSSGSSDMEKKAKDAPFVKDILSFANTPRKIAETSYIIIGVENKTKNLIGINNVIDEATLQQKVSSKTYPVPYFKYYTFEYKSKLFGIIEIPVKKYELPCKPSITINTNGGIEKNQVYFRRRDSNETANYEEQVKIQKWLDSLPKNTEKLIIDRRNWFQKKRYIIALLLGLLIIGWTTFFYYNDSRVDLHLKNGEAEFKKNHFLQAVMELNKGLDWIELFKVNWHLSEEKCDECRDTLEYYAHFYDIRATALGKLNNYEKAIEDIYKCIYLSKNDLKYETILGDFFMKDTLYEDATKIYAKILEEDFNKEEFYYIKFKQAMCYFLMAKSQVNTEKFQNIISKFIKNITEIENKTDLLIDFKYQYFNDFGNRIYYHEINSILNKIQNRTKLIVKYNKLLNEFRLE